MMFEDWEVGIFVFSSKLLLVSLCLGCPERGLIETEGYQVCTKCNVPGNFVRCTSFTITSRSVVEGNCGCIKKLGKTWILHPIFVRWVQVRSKTEQWVVWGSSSQRPGSAHAQGDSPWLVIMTCRSSVMIVWCTCRCLPVMATVFGAKAVPPCLLSYFLLYDCHPPLSSLAKWEAFDRRLVTRKDL